MCVKVAINRPNFVQSLAKDMDAITVLGSDICMMALLVPSLDPTKLVLLVEFFISGAANTAHMLSHNRQNSFH